MSYSEILDETVYVAALRLAKGCYQRNLLSGFEALSGSTLKGKAGRYRGGYKRSSAALLARCLAAGLPISERRGDHGKRILVIGARK